MEIEVKSPGEEVTTESNSVATVTPAPPPPIKLNRAERRRLMKRFGTFGRLAKIGKIKV